MTEALELDRDHPSGRGQETNASAEAAIEIRAVTHAYNTATGSVPVLNDVSIVCPDQSFTAVVGPSGCGKSTLTRLISGLLQPDRGEIFLHGKLVTSPRPTVGMAFQNPVLFEWRTIASNVMLPLEIVPNKLSASERRQRALELLSLVGLDGFEDKRPSELSGGMKQRASLCRALVHRPELLILDEPFGALDAFTREDLWQIMQELRRKEAISCFLITHDLRESVFLADQVIVLSDRPAHVQNKLDIELKADRNLDDLYTPEATDLLHFLRNQIEIAQGRATKSPNSSAPT